MAQLLLILVAVSSIFLPILEARKMEIDREAIINSVINEVKKEFAREQDASTSPIQEKLNAFKTATPETLAQGIASLKFERIVKLAEQKILRLQTMAAAQTYPESAMVEELLAELLHRPGRFLTVQEIGRIQAESGCSNIPLQPNCDSEERKLYRSADGTCNNLVNKTLGSASTPLRRLIPARYDDGVSRARGFLQSQSIPPFGTPFSSPNPSPRIVSTTINTDISRREMGITHILMQWGQFVDHDIGASPEHETCPSSCSVTPELEGNCYPIPVPETDNNIEVTKKDSKKCAVFKRSLGACPPAGIPTNSIPPREQLNGITHFHDASMIYGHSDDILNNEIRDMSASGTARGSLRTGKPAEVGSQKPLLPDAQPGSFIVCPEGTKPCFLGGDLRANEQSGLTIMHTIWVREHNRIAEFIADNNPSYDSDKVFQTTRKIVGAMVQKITYHEFLPALFGDQYSTLIPQYQEYVPNVDPRIPNAFSTAAYRFGHSLINGEFQRLDDDYKPSSEGPLPLVDAFFNTQNVRKYGTDSLLRGLLVDHTSSVDQYISHTLTNRLFADDASTPGMDLASLNIQRGRDHGLPAYAAWKQWAKAQCNVESVFRGEATASSLLQLYGNVGDIDLFVGGLAEEPLSDTCLLGATFACIISKTFRDLRDGDRFYYENTDPEYSYFTTEQREQLSKASLSRVICDNTDITTIQPDAFKVNARVPCSNIPSIDLTPWVETTHIVEPLPETCYIRIRAWKPAVYFATSYNEVPSDSEFNQRILSSLQEACFSIKCPTTQVPSSFAVGSQNSGCSPSVNPSLPATLDALPGSTVAYPDSVYIQQLDASYFTQSGSGLFTSEGSCDASSVLALDFDCNPQAILQNDHSFLHAELMRLAANDKLDRVEEGSQLDINVDAFSTKLMQLASKMLSKEELVNLIAKVLREKEE